MITKNEIEATKLSVTKKDYYQIWQELVETATKLSERWGVSSTNESDPGIVLLKTLTAIADKLNYNIDKNTLETMMPSAAQEESIRKLCSMMGYNVKYYQSATTEVTVSYLGSKDSSGNLLDADGNVIQSLEIPIFTSIKNADDDINYLTIEPETLSQNKSSVQITCIEGELVQCETDSDNIISINLLNDDNRYYLPEAYIAENGVFVYNLDDGGDETATVKYTEKWTQVNNLNTQSLNTKCYKFGFDSIKGLPYLQFPEDVSTLISDGLIIYYVRTKGASGNISAFTLSKISKFWSDELEYNITEDNFSAINNSAAVNGANIETINKAYQNYKKTVGTFDTLVTCRDYMNKIYQLVSEEDNTTPLVSNCIASDIRDDINKAVNICTFNDYGLCYVNRALAGSGSETAITHFDLLLYPFKTYSATNSNIIYNYKESFNFSTAKWLEILNGLEQSKTISHNFRAPISSDIALIKVYYKLNIRINPTYVLSSAEEKVVRNNIYSALCDAFNLHELEFGEQLNTDDILTCIQNADRRIRTVFLDTPELYVNVQTVDNNESTRIYNSDNKSDSYIKLVARNVLGGRIPLFNYNSSFKPDFTDHVYDAATAPVIKPEYPYDERHITKIKPNLTIDTAKIDTVVSDEKAPLTLAANEVIRFRAPSFHTKVTYPAYVNYYIVLKDKRGESSKGTAAEFITLATFMEETVTDGSANKLRWEIFVNSTQASGAATSIEISSAEQFNTLATKYKHLFTYSAGAQTYSIAKQYSSTISTYYYFEYNEANFPKWKNWILTQKTSTNITADIYRIIDTSYLNQPGYLVDIDHRKYQVCNQFKNVSGNSAIDNNYVATNVGKDADLLGVPVDTEYALQEGEYLLINYTKSSSDDSSTKTIIQEAYGPGKIIKPNFKILDSATQKASGKSYSKKEGIEPFEPYGYATPEGMFTLGASEQIEIREQTTITLGSETARTAINLYWTLTQIVLEDNVYKKKPVVLENKATWELKAGEYFCYTDADKNSMAYYGAGTIIVNNTGKDLKLKDGVKELSIEDIATKGISGIDWTTFYLEADQLISVKEYQYINLTESDQLFKITFKDKGRTEFDSSKWYQLKANDAEVIAQYSISGDTKSLPNFVMTDCYWEATTVLNMNVSSNMMQTLRANDKPAGTTVIHPCNSSIEVIYDSGASDTIKLNEAGDLLSLKTNLTLQASSNSIDTISYAYNDDETTYHIDYDYSLKIKTLLYKDCYIMDGKKAETPVSLHNYSEIYTSLTSKEIVTKPSKFISTWDAETGKPDSYPEIPPTETGLSYTYKYSAGDYYTINKVAASDNKIPTGASITATRSTVTDPWVWTVGSATYSGKIEVNTNFVYSRTAWSTEYKTVPLSISIANNCFGLIMFQVYGEDAEWQIKAKKHYLGIYNNITTSAGSTKYGQECPWWDGMAKETGDEFIYTLKKGINIVSLPSTCTEITLTKANPTESSIIFSDLDIISSANYGVNYKVLGLSNSVCTSLLQKIYNCDTNKEFYYNCPVDAASAINVNYIEGTNEETLATAKTWFDYNNINNKFVVSEIDAEYLKSGIVFSNMANKR